MVEAIGTSDGSVLGVATGIVMEFQLGTDSSACSRFVGQIIGSALAAEGIFAFASDSGFFFQPFLGGQ